MAPAGAIAVPCRVGTGAGDARLLPVPGVRTPQPTGIRPRPTVPRLVDGPAGRPTAVLVVTGEVTALGLGVHTRVVGPATRPTPSLGAGGGVDIAPVRAVLVVAVLEAVLEVGGLRRPALAVRPPAKGPTGPATGRPSGTRARLVVEVTSEIAIRQTRLGTRKIVVPFTRLAVRAGRRTSVPTVTRRVNMGPPLYVVTGVRRPRVRRVPDARPALSVEEGLARDAVVTADVGTPATGVRPCMVVVTGRVHAGVLAQAAPPFAETLAVVGPSRRPRGEAVRAKRVGLVTVAVTVARPDLVVAAALGRVAPRPVPVTVAVLVAVAKRPAALLPFTGRPVVDTGTGAAPYAVAGTRRLFHARRVGTGAPTARVPAGVAATMRLVPRPQDRQAVGPRATTTVLAALVGRAVTRRVAARRAFLVPTDGTPLLLTRVGVPIARPGHAPPTAPLLLRLEGRVQTGARPRVTARRIRVLAKTGSRRGAVFPLRPPSPVGRAWPFWLRPPTDD